MIDTIRFRIKIPEDIYRKIREKAVEITKHDNGNGTTYFNILHSNISVGSYSRKINIFVSDQDTLFLEFSIPKYYYGHNIFLLYPDKIQPCIDKIFRELVEYFGDFPNPIEWFIERLDLCYAWKLPSQETAQDILDVLRSYPFPRKKMSFYDTSLMAVGSTYSIKFYLKHPEFYKHDFKEILKNQSLMEYAHDLLNISEGVLRFEVTLRSKALYKYFPKRLFEKITVQDLDSDIIAAILENIYKKFVKGIKPKLMTPTEVYQTLKKVYNPNKARILWEFYMIYHASDPNISEVLRKSYSRIAIYKNLRDLAKAKVGIPRKDINFDIDLSIPSDYCINPNNAIPAQAGLLRLVTPAKR